MVTLDIGVGEVRATAFHPFWVIEGQNLENRLALRHVDVFEDRGGFLPGRWVNSHDLSVGDLVFLKDIGAVPIRRVMQRHERMPVCNLTVLALHTLAVGEQQVLVHNVTGSGDIDPPQGPRPRTLQTGGNTIDQSTADALGMQRREAGRALEAMKRDLGLPNNHHGTNYEQRRLRRRQYWRYPRKFTRLRSLKVPHAKQPK
jgi:hypothetical protein